MAQTGIAIAPQPTSRLDSAAHGAEGVVDDIARYHGMVAVQGADQGFENWKQCYAKVNFNFVICGKLYNNEVQFRIYQAHVARFGVGADSIRREVLDSLVSRFGGSQVRECRWIVRSSAPGSGCAPASVGKS
jgi:hypothetical protein